jgi:hypothetical protein
MSEEMYGNPQQESAYWEEQSHPEDCVEMSTADVVGQLTGDEPTEQSITTLALDTPSDVHGGDIYSPTGGTYLQDAQELLSHYGVNSQYYSDQSGSPSGLATLEKALADGGRPIVAVDGPRIWDAIGDNAGADPGQADHAVVVTGVDTQTGMVYLNDSGAPNGREEAVPIDVFMSAWSTSGHSMVVADEKGASTPSTGPSTPASTQSQSESNPFVPPGEEPQQTFSVATEGQDPIPREDEMEAVIAALGIVGATMGVLHRRRGRTAQIPPYQPGQYQSGRAYPSGMAAPGIPVSAPPPPAPGAPVSR